MTHDVVRTKVDASALRPHEVAQGIVTIMVALWCGCGYRAGGTSKLGAAEADHDDTALRHAIEDAEGSARYQFANHVESETTL